MKRFTQNQLNILPEMGYYVCKFSNPYNLNDNHIQLVGIYCLMNGQLKFCCGDGWHSRNWNTGPTKNKIKESKTKRGYFYEYFSSFEELVSQYTCGENAPNDFISSENGKVRIEDIKKIKLPDNVKAGWYISKRPRLGGRYYSYDYIVSYISETKIWICEVHLKTIGGLPRFYSHKTSKIKDVIEYDINNGTRLSSYEDMVLFEPHVLNYKFLKIKPKWAEF